MPSDPTPEQTELRRKGRQRLVGAVVLALLAVVFVPMILDPAPRMASTEPVLSIPAREGAPALALAPGAAPSPAASPAEPAPPRKEGEAPQAANPSEPAAAAKTPDAAPVPKAAAKAPGAGRTEEPRAAPVPRLEGFAVQVGAFKEESKLAQARDKLKRLRLAHYTERLATASGDLTRLRAGPFPTREAADKAAADMKKAGLEGRVVPLP